MLQILLAKNYSATNSKKFLQLDSCSNKAHENKIKIGQNLDLQEHTKLNKEYQKKTRFINYKIF